MSSDTPLRYVSNGVGNVRKPDNPNGLWTLEIERMSAFSLIDIAAQIEGIEWILLLIIIAVLLLYGPKKLPELARGVGRALGEFRRGKMEIEREISTELSTMDARDMRMRVEKAAGALGVSAGGRSEMQLKIDIARAD